MRIARPLLTVAVLALAAACANGSSITSPSADGVARSQDAAPGGGYMGTGNDAPSDTTDSTERGGGYIGTGNNVEAEGGGYIGTGNDTAAERGGYIGTGNDTAPDTTGTTERGGGWIGSDN
jgi:hypothetical protein